MPSISDMCSELTGVFEYILAQPDVELLEVRALSHNTQASLLCHSNFNSMPLSQCLGGIVVFGPFFAG